MDVMDEMDNVDKLTCPSRLAAEGKSQSRTSLAAARPGGAKWPPESVQGPPLKCGVIPLNCGVNPRIVVLFGLKWGVRRLEMWCYSAEMWCYSAFSGSEMWCLSSGKAFQVQEFQSCASVVKVDYI